MVQLHRCITIYLSKDSIQIMSWFFKKGAPLLKPSLSNHSNKATFNWWYLNRSYLMHIAKKCHPLGWLVVCLPPRFTTHGQQAAARPLGKGSNQRWPDETLQKKGGFLIHLLAKNVHESLVSMEACMYIFRFTICVCNESLCWLLIVKNGFAPNLFFHARERRWISKCVCLKWFWMPNGPRNLGKF